MKYITTILAILITASLAMAEMKTGSWTYEVEWEAGIEGFRLYDQDKEIVVDAIAPAARAVEFDVDLEVGCQAFFMTAFSESEESPISNIATFCPKPKQLRRPGPFSVN